MRCRCSAQSAEHRLCVILSETGEAREAEESPCEKQITLWNLSASLAATLKMTVKIVIAKGCKPTLWQSGWVKTELDYHVAASRLLIMTVLCYCERNKVKFKDIALKLPNINA